MAGPSRCKDPPCQGPWVDKTSTMLRRVDQRSGPGIPMCRTRPQILVGTGRRARQTRQDARDKLADERRGMSRDGLMDRGGPRPACRWCCCNTIRRNHRSSFSRLDRLSVAVQQPFLVRQLNMPASNAKSLTMGLAVNASHPSILDGRAGTGRGFYAWYAWCAFVRAALMPPST